MIEKIAEKFYMAANFILLFLANILISSSIVYLLKGSINNFVTIISFLITITEIFMLTKGSKKKVIIYVLIAIVAFSICNKMAEFVYDSSYDGNAYHKEAIGLIKNGWNPVYEECSEFATKNGLTCNHPMWIEHYAKTTWIIGASVYNITGNIESAKSYNFLIVFCVFFIIAYLINKYYGKKLLSIIVAIAAVSFPIVCQQIFSFYVDAFLGYVLFLIVIYINIIIKEKENKDYFWYIGALLIIIINIKYSGLLYSGLFCFGYYLYYLIKKIKEKDIKELIVTTSKFAVIVIVSVLLVGSNSYVRNLIDHKNPLYPLIGKDKVDIMTYLQPASFANKSSIEKNLISIYSYTADVGVYNNGEPELKIPFTIRKSEFYQFAEDTRIGGYGIFFSGIFTLSIIVITVHLIISIKNKKYYDLVKYGIPMGIVILIMFVVSDSWWARYAPQLYLIPLMALLILLTKKNVVPKIIGIMLFCLMVTNSLIIAREIYIRRVPTSYYLKSTYELFANEETNLQINNKNFSGVYFNLDDYNIKYVEDDEIDGYYSLYGDAIRISMQK